MTPDQINIAIAEHTRPTLTSTLTMCRECYGSGRQGSEGDCWLCELCKDGRVEPYYVGPNYAGDLNAMHEVEKVLNRDQRIDYWERMVELTGCYSDCLYATATQRAKAFLRTVGKWKDRNAPSLPVCPQCGFPINYGIDGHCSFFCSMESRLKP